MDKNILKNLLLIIILIFIFDNKEIFYHLIYKKNIIDTLPSNSKIINNK